MRVVLDTNILVSALITKGTPPDQLYQAWLRGEIELVTSASQIEEVADVLARPRLRRYVDSDEATQMVAAIHQRATVLTEIPEISRSPDPKDDPILAVAVAGRVGLVVSGDKGDMLGLGTWRASRYGLRERRWGSHSRRKRTTEPSEVRGDHVSEREPAKSHAAKERRVLHAALRHRE